MACLRISWRSTGGYGGLLGGNRAQFPVRAPGPSCLPGALYLRQKSPQLDSYAQAIPYVMHRELRPMHVAVFDSTPVPAQQRQPSSGLSVSWYTPLVASLLCLRCIRIAHTCAVQQYSVTDGGFLSLRSQYWLSVGQRWSLSKQAISLRFMLLVRCVEIEQGPELLIPRSRLCSVKAVAPLGSGRGVAVFCT
jgi:hypothetical protein